MKKAYVLLFDGYADWEIGHILAELRRLGDIAVKTVGFATAPVTSMGGLNVQPDMPLSQVEPDDMLIFILPGGAMWEGEYPKDEVNVFLQTLDQKQIPIAGICAATTALARAGVLQNKKHTSNSLQYLKDQTPGYSGQGDYVPQMAIADGSIITASGLGAVDFTMKILETLDISTPDMRTFWYNAFKHGEYPEGAE